MHILLCILYMILYIIYCYICISFAWNICLFNIIYLVFWIATSIQINLPINWFLRIFPFNGIIWRQLLGWKIIIRLLYWKGLEISHTCLIICLEMKCIFYSKINISIRTNPTVFYVDVDSIHEISTEHCNLFYIFHRKSSKNLKILKHSQNYIRKFTFVIYSLHANFSIEMHILFLNFLPK